MNHYLIALGSNRAGKGARRPRAALAAALTALTAHGITVEQVAPVLETAPLGPSRRRFANSAALIATPLGPAALLHQLKQVERQLGRRPGQRWGARAIDLDIILWSGGRFLSRTLTIPHPHWCERPFVLVPLLAIAPAWRDPWSGRAIRHLAARQNPPRQGASISSGQALAPLTRRARVPIGARAAPDI